jgi:hypothetical protein
MEPISTRFGKCPTHNRNKAHLPYLLVLGLYLLAAIQVWRRLSMAPSSKQLTIDTTHTYTMLETNRENIWMKNVFKAFAKPKVFMLRTDFFPITDQKWIVSMDK